MVSCDLRLIFYAHLAKTGHGLPKAAATSGDIAAPPRLTGDA